MHHRGFLIQARPQKNIETKIQKPPINQSQILVTSKHLFISSFEFHTQLNLSESDHFPEIQITSFIHCQTLMDFAQLYFGWLESFAPTHLTKSGARAWIGNRVQCLQILQRPQRAALSLLVQPTGLLIRSDVIRQFIQLKSHYATMKTRRQPLKQESNHENKKATMKTREATMKTRL